MCIYFIQPVDGGLIKIGYGVDVDFRFKSIQANSPLRLKVLGIIEGGTIKMEKLIHKRFGKYRVYYEWFLPDDEILNFINYPYQINKDDIEKDDMGICHGLCRDGERCLILKLDGSDYCRLHQNQASIPSSDWVKVRHIAVRCSDITVSGNPCNAFAIPGNPYCANHRLRRMRETEI